MSDSNRPPYNTTEALARLKVAEEARVKDQCRRRWVTLPGDHPATFEVAWTNEWCQRFRDDPYASKSFADLCDRRRRQLPPYRPD
jgi:hypothetical protein